MRPPAFRDPHDSQNLDQPASASWHGPDTRRHMVFAAVLVVAAAAAAVTLMAFTDASTAGPSVSDPGGTAVQPDDGVDDPEIPAVPDQPPVPDPGNVTLPPTPKLPTP